MLTIDAIEARLEWMQYATNLGIELFCSQGC